MSGMNNLLILFLDGFKKIQANFQKETYTLNVSTTSDVVTIVFKKESDDGESQSQTHIPMFKTKEDVDYWLRTIETKCKYFK